MYMYISKVDSAQKSFGDHLCYFFFPLPVSHLLKYTLSFRGRFMRVPSVINTISHKKKGGHHHRLSCARESTAFWCKSCDRYIVIILSELLPMIQSKEVLQTCCVRMYHQMSGFAPA